MEGCIGIAEQITTDRDIPPGSVALVDLRKAAEVEVSGDGVRRASQIFRTNSRSSKTAFVVAHELAFGWSRMYELLQNDLHEISVFKGIEEAEHWLGLV